MASILDVLFSIVLGGMLMVTMLGANDVAVESTALLHGDQMVQESAVDLAMYLDGEMRNMGFGVSDSMLIVLHADSNDVVYCVSLPPFSKVDTVHFYLGSTAELASTPNTMDRYIYRTQDGGAAIPVGVVTYLRFRYYDRSDSLMSFPITSNKLGQVFKVEVTTEVQNSYAPYRDKSMVQAGQQDALYSSFLWSQTRLTSQNIRFSARPAQKPQRVAPPVLANNPPPPQGPVKANPAKNNQQPVKPPPAPGAGPRPVKPPPPPPPPPPPALGVN